MKLMNLFESRVDEALPLSLAKQFTTGMPVYPMHEKVFARQSDTNRNHTRIYIPLESKPQPVRVPRALQNALQSMGYEVFDYVKGLANKIGDKKRLIKIGRLLVDSNPALKKKFESDPQRAASRQTLAICISRHPYDYAGMSTDRGWTSCMKLADSDDNRYKLISDIKLGSLVAYLIRSDDRNIKNPLGRIAIRPYVNVDKLNDIVMQPGRVYGTTRAGFVETVQQWIDANYNQGKFGLYCIHDGAYDDRDGDVFKIDLSAVQRNPQESAKRLNNMIDSGNLTRSDELAMRDKISTLDPQTKKLLIVGGIHTDLIADIDKLLDAELITYALDAKNYSIFDDYSFAAGKRIAKIFFDNPDILRRITQISELEEVFEWEAIVDEHASLQMIKKIIPILDEEAQHTLIMYAPSLFLKAIKLHPSVVMNVIRKKKEVRHYIANNLDVEGLAPALRKLDKKDTLLLATSLMNAANWPSQRDRYVAAFAQALGTTKTAVRRMFPNPIRRR